MNITGLKVSRKQQMSRFSSFSVIGVLMLLCLFIGPASAILQEVTVKSTVSTINPAKNSLTIGFPLQYGCSYPASGPQVCTWTPMTDSSLSGTVPDQAAFILFKAGDPIVGTSIGGAGGSWIALAKLYGTRPNEEFITDIVGEPSAIPTPLIGDYALKVTTSPDCTQCSGATCTAKSSDVAVMSGIQTLSEKVLLPGQNMVYNGRNDGSSVSVTFVKGEAVSGACPQAQPGISGVQPVSVYLVTIVPPIGYTQNNIRTATTTSNEVQTSTTMATPVLVTPQASATPVTTPKAASLPFLALSAFGISGILLMRKK